MECQFCHAQMIGRKRKYCDRRCRKRCSAASHRLKLKAAQWPSCYVRIDDCRGCGKLLVRRSNPPSKWCSRKCSYRACYANKKANAPEPTACVVRYANCAACGALFASGRRRKFCPQKTCLKARNAAKMRDRYAADPELDRLRVAIARLDPEYVAREAAYAKAYNERVGWTDAKRAAYQRRRARKYAVPTENIRSREVFDRDGWQCGICSEAVDPELTYPDPRSASLDHVKPLSLGGAHVMGNVRCAHLVCNTKRGARDVA